MKYAHVNRLIEEILNDRTVPRNVRVAVEDIIGDLKNDDQNMNVKLNNAISVLDDVANDPNIPMYTRTQIWNIVSALETEKN